MIKKRKNIKISLHEFQESSAVVSCLSPNVGGKNKMMVTWYKIHALALTESPAATFSMFLVRFSIFLIVCSGMAAGIGCGGIRDGAGAGGFGLLLLLAAAALAAAAANCAKCCWWCRNNSTDGFGMCRTAWLGGPCLGFVSEARDDTDGFTEAAATDALANEPEVGGTGIRRGTFPLRRFGEHDPFPLWLLLLLLWWWLLYLGDGDELDIIFLMCTAVSESVIKFRMLGGSYWPPLPFVCDDDPLLLLLLLLFLLTVVYC
ncbi:hypothetical protein AGLY_009705 [Aphis glycines]|uniref:Uncharacterized protein n=1 Tax=Aphis glycines TaxID=307491 RepID=A0A6G0TGL3_APHGL|nr:hypothetical protein AGLY_009705 [Aphis glycines]